MFKNAFSNVNLAINSVSNTFETTKISEVEEVDLSSITSTKEMSIENYYKKIGFTDLDIKRLINNEITPDALLVEIEKDSDQTRYKKLMELSYLQNYKNSLVSKKDSKEMIKLFEKNIKSFQKEKKKLERNNDDFILISFISCIKNGSSYDDVMKETAVWVDAEGNKYYQKPVATREQVSKTYKEITYEEIFGKNNANLVEFKNSLKNGKWIDSNSQKKAYKSVVKTANELKKTKEETIKKLDKALMEFKKQKKQLKKGATDVKFDFDSMDELNLAIIDTKDKLKKYREEKVNLESNTKVNDFSNMISFINLLKNGKSYEDALDEVAAWVGENGEITYVNPYSLRESSNTYYKAISYKDLYKDSNEFKQIKGILKDGKWVNSEKSKYLFKQFVNKRDTLKINNEKRLKELNKEIKDLEEAYSVYTSAQTNINTEVNYYLKNIHSYINKDVNSNGNIFNTKTATNIYVSSDDMLYENMQSWLPFMSDTEKEIFNYIYNTKGKKFARKYLEDISDMLDKRWTADKESKDRQFAEKHPVLATTLSIVKTPFEGMNAAYLSSKSVYNGDKINGGY